MFKILFLSTLLISLFSSLVNAQKKSPAPYCIVLAVEGMVRINGEVISASKELNSQDQLQLADGGDYVSLLFYNGYTTELSGKGLYNLSSLKAGRDDANDFTTMCRWYTNYKPQTGRQLIEVAFIDRHTIEILPAQPIYVGKTDSIKVIWKVNLTNVPKEFRVKFTNIWGDLIQSFKTTKSSVDFNFKDLQTDSMDSLIVLSISFYNGRDSIEQQCTLKFLKDNKLELTSIKAADWIVKAFSLEQENLHYPQLKLYYSKALELAPQVDDYKRYYHHYLFRKHLSVFNEIRNIGYLFKVTKFTGDCLHNSKALKNRAYIKWEDLLEVRSGEVHLEHISGIKITLKPGAYNTFELSDRIY